MAKRIRLCGYESTSSGRAKGDWGGRVAWGRLKVIPRSDAHASGADCNFNGIVAASSVHWNGCGVDVDAG